jgi:hypothetical protein
MPSEAFKEFVPDFTFAFFNIGKVDEHKVQENVVLKFYVAIIKALDSPELRELLPQLTQGLYKSLGQRTALEYIEIFFKYLTKATEKLIKEDYQKALDIFPEGGEDIMNTLADQWINEGEQRILQQKPQWIEYGKLEATQENLLDIATEQFGPLPTVLQDTIKSIQSIDNLQALMRKVHRTNSLDEFTDLVNRAAES